MSAAVLFFTLDYFFGDTILHLLRVVYIPVHRKGGGGVAKANLYLLRADFLLGEQCRVRVPERVKAYIVWKLELSLEFGEDISNILSAFL